MFEEKHKVKKIIIIEIMLIVIIFFIALVLYWFLTTTKFEDPIAEMKNNFLLMQLRLIGISLLETVIVTIFTKNKRKLIRNLIIVAILSIVMIIAQVGAKIYIDNKYNEEEFSQLYETYKDENDEYYKDISISMSGVSLIGAKESYVKKSISSYKIFELKTMIYIIIHILLVILMLYIINKLTIIEAKKLKLANDDIFYGKDKE